MTDLSVIVVSYNSAEWIPRCFDTLLAHQGAIQLESIVVDNGSTDNTCRLVEEQYGQVRLVRAENRGFAHGNNQGIELAQGRYILLLNPDTEIKEGLLSDLVSYLDRNSNVGLVGVRQVDAAGNLLPTVRRFPTALRVWGDGLGLERMPRRPGMLGERELRTEVYGTDVACDWTVGSFMLIRRDALMSVGALDDRFFLYGEETDLCLRIRAAGWDVRHLPTMTILHHVGEARAHPRMVAQSAFARRQYARKHFSRLHRAAFSAGMLASAGIRAAAPGRSPQASRRREAARASLGVLLGQKAPPFGIPAATAASTSNRLPAHQLDNMRK